MLKKLKVSAIGMLEDKALLLTLGTVLVASAVGWYVAVSDWIVRP